MALIRTNNPIDDFTVYLNSLNIPIYGVSCSVFPPTDPTAQITIQFQSSATQDQINQANAAIGTFDWAAVATPVIQYEPNIPGFLNAIAADPNLANVQVELASYIAAVQQYNVSPAYVQGLWQGLISQFGSSWLTSAVQQSILNDAAANNIQLVVP